MSNLKTQIVFDSILNIIAAAVPIVILQLFILPLIASNLGGQGYGLMLTLISLITLFSESYGNVLNNTRLLQNESYKRAQAEGDFNLLLIWGALVNSLIVCVGTYYYQMNFKDISGILIVANLILMRSYYIVAFRLTLNYRGILINNFLLAVGYLIGLLFFSFGCSWTIIYVLGNCISLGYIFSKSKLVTESYKKTELFPVTFRKNLLLFGADVMKTTLSYADKLLIFPILGAETVTIYYSASIIGKIILMAITPISSVFLSYLIQVDRLKKRVLYLILLSVSILAVVGYGSCLLAGKYILIYIYPQWAQESLNLLPLTTAILVFSAMISVIQPITLRFLNEKYQLLVNGIILIVYLALTCMLSVKWGVYGFCIGYLTANICKLIFLIILMAKPLETIN